MADACGMELTAANAKAALRKLLWRRPEPRWGSCARPPPHATHPGPARPLGSIPSHRQPAAPAAAPCSSTPAAKSPCPRALAAPRHQPLCWACRPHGHRGLRNTPSLAAAMRQALQLLLCFPTLETSLRRAWLGHAGHSAPAAQDCAWPPPCINRCARTPARRPAVCTDGLLRP